jgi:hypothetical protein
MHDYFVSHRRRPVVAFLDIKSAYDTVDRRVIWQALASSSLPRAVLALLINLFDEVSVSVLIANHTSAAFCPTTGVLQGSVLSPHLYSLYINSLPSYLRSGATGATMISVPDATAPIAINSLLFADDVAIFGSKVEVQRMLDVAAGHSLSLGYRWNPSKCAVLGTATALAGDPLVLYDEALPVVEEFTYLGIPFRYNGLYAPGILSLRSAGAVKTMALLNSVGVNRNGFSLLLSARLYKAFIRPKIEYGLAISHLSSRDFTAMDTLQNRLVGMFVGSTWVNVAKHITCLPSMKHRYNVLATRLLCVLPLCLVIRCWFCFVHNCTIQGWIVSYVKTLCISLCLLLYLPLLACAPSLMSTGKIRWISNCLLLPLLVNMFCFVPAALTLHARIPFSIFQLVDLLVVVLCAGVWVVLQTRERNAHAWMALLSLGITFPGVVPWIAIFGMLCLLLLLVSM